MNRQRLELLFKGLAAGDALGSTVEFVPREEMPRRIESLRETGWPFKQAGGGPFHWQVGETTDDTAMAACIARSFIRRGGFDGADLANEFLKWLHSRPRDVGNTIRRTLEAIGEGTSWQEAALNEYRQNPTGAANGSLMRNGIVPALADSLEEAFSISLQQGILTHYAPLPALCCCAQTFLIWELLESRDPFTGDWIQGFLGRFEDFLASSKEPAVAIWQQNTADDFREWSNTLARSDFNAMRVDPYVMSIEGQDGYCLTTLQIAVWAAQWSQSGAPFPTPVGFPSDHFSRATGAIFLPAVVMIGHDADTYGAVAGPLIAAVHGAVPDELTAGLKSPAMDHAI